jgi:hypothetical protein
VTGGLLYVATQEGWQLKTYAAELELDLASGQTVYLRAGHLTPHTPRGRGIPPALVAWSAANSVSLIVAGP